MDQRTKIKVAVNLVCLAISIAALYTFVAVVDVTTGWRIALVIIAISWIVSGVSNLIAYFHKDD